MLVPKKDRIAVYSYLFQEGVCVAKKDFIKEKHDEIDVSNLYVIKLLTSLKSRGYVRETFSWQYYYWYLTTEGIEYLREYLHLPQEIVPNTLKKAAARPPRPAGPPRDMGRGPRFGDKKIGPSGEFNPEFRREGGFGRGGQDGYRREGGGRGFGRGGQQ